MIEIAEIILAGCIVGIILLLLMMRRVFSPLTKIRGELRETQKQWQGVVDFLNVFSRSLSAKKNPQDILHHVAHYVCRILRAESAAIYRLEEHETTGRPVLRPVAINGSFPLLREEASSSALPRKHDERLAELRRNPFALGEGIIGEAAQSESSVVIRHRNQIGGRAIPFFVSTCICAPIELRGHVVGVLCVSNRRFGGKPFDRRDRRTVEQLAMQVGVGMDLLNIYDERSNQERLIQELEFGREIQHSLLPPPLPQWQDYRLSAFSEPALEVAGDNYDIVEIGDHRLMVVVADATGKGVPACMLSAMARSFVRSLAEGFDGMEEFLIKLNGCIFHDTDTAHFLTMGVLVLDQKSGVCEYACAGHTPLLLRFADGATRCISPEGPALGLLPNDLGVEFDTLSFSFEPGCSVMLFSDGFTEALNPDGEEYGVDRLEALWQERAESPDAMRDRIVEDVRAFTRNRAQNDDRTLIVISREGAEEKADRGD